MSYVVGAVLLVVGVGCLMTGVMRAVRAFRSEDWERVPGRVVISEVTAHGVGPDRDHRLDFAYTYEVGGTTYTGTTIRYRVWGRSAGGARVVQRYPEGTGVAVRVDPSDPARAVLEPGGGWPMLALPVVGLLSVVVGALLLA